MLPSCGPRSESGPSNAGNGSNAVNSTTNTSREPRTNAEELGLIVNLPYESDEAIWKEDAARKKVTAVLRFSPDVAKTIVGQAEKVRPPLDVQIPAESWFPAELVAQSQMSGDANLKGKAYAAKDFYMEPYTDGTITRVDGTDYFVLELTRK